MAALFSTLFTADEIAEFDPALTFTTPSLSSWKTEASLDETSSTSISSTPIDQIFASDSGRHLWQSLLRQHESPVVASTAAKWEKMNLHHRLLQTASTVHLSLATVVTPNALETVRDNHRRNPSALFLLTNDKKHVLALNSHRPVDFGSELIDKSQTMMSQLPKELLAAALKLTFVALMVNSGEWLPIEDADNTGTVLLWRQSLPCGSTASLEDTKLFGIKMGTVVKDVEGYYSLAYMVQSYAHRAVQSAYTCLPRLGKTVAISDPYVFEGSEKFPDWASLAEYWRTKHAYVLSDSRMVIEVRFQTAGSLTYPVECLIPGILKFGPITTYVDRPVSVPLMRTALRNLILSSGNHWNSAFLKSAAPIPLPVRSFDRRRQSAPQASSYTSLLNSIEHVVDAKPRLTEDDDEAWCRDLYFSQDAATLRSISPPSALVARPRKRARPEESPTAPGAHVPTKRGPLALLFAPPVPPFDVANLEIPELEHAPCHAEGLKRAKRASNKRKLQIEDAVPDEGNHPTKSRRKS